MPEASPYFNPYETPVVNRRILHQRKVATEMLVCPQSVQDAKFVIEKLVGPELVASLTAFVLTDQICERRQTVTLEVPASWWQHFKRDVLPGWLTRSRWFRKHMPVRLSKMEQTVIFSEERMYPDCHYALPYEYGKPVIIETVTNTPWRTRNEFC